MATRVRQRRTGLYALLRAFECECLAGALRRTNGNQTQAAQFLGVARTTFVTKMGHCKR